MVQLQKSILLFLSSFVPGIWGGHDYSWEQLEVNLPMPVSDISATYDEATDRIYIIGGCDDPQGNSQLTPTLFICSSITAKGFAFNPNDLTFESLPDAPRDRYRHSASNVNGKIWLVGGRTVDDIVIPEIDVYDPVEKTWSTVGSLPPELQFSDQASFFHESYIYVVGGYVQDYAAMNVTFRISAESSTDDGLITEVMEPLNVARGDIHAVVIDDLAYVTGGYTHEDGEGGFCIPHSSTERYDIKENKWTMIDDMETGRADKALVELNGQIFAVGGESKEKELCTGDTAEYTMPLDDIEVLKDPHLDAIWESVGTAPSRVFRFAGAAHPPTNSIFVFGGQEFYNAACECFATSNVITKFVDHEDSDSMDESSTAWRLDFSMFAVVISSIILF